MDIEEIKFSDSLTIYKTKYNWKYGKEDFIKKIDINYYMVGLTDINTSKIFLTCNEFDSVHNISFEVCKKLSNIDEDTWDNTYINNMWVYRQSSNYSYEDYHAHKYPIASNFIENEVLNTWTSCFYLKIPSDLVGDEGKIFFKDSQNNEFSLLPEEGDMLFFGADVLHKPKPSPNSKTDRISICSNYSFEIPKLKNKRTLL